MQAAEEMVAIGECKENEDMSEEPLIHLENSIAKEGEDKENKELESVVQRVGGFLAFKRWINSFRMKKTPLLQPYVEGWADTPWNNCSNAAHLSSHAETQEQQWEKLSGDSSHLGIVKTATMSATSESVVRSRRTTQSTTNRVSIESSRPPLSLNIDEDAKNRATRRRQVLREIISTESDYIFGLKALTDILLIFFVRPEIYHNIQRIRETHEDFLARVRNVTPMSCLSGAEVDKLPHATLNQGFGTVDLGLKALQNRSLRTRKFKASIEYRLKELVAEANEALEVSREIGRLSTSLTVYKEFCKNYELLLEDTTILRQSIPNWSVFEQGIEALTKSAASMENKALYQHKSLYLSDLLIKPTQRLCKYPLFLKELLKCTYIQDDPSAYNELGQILESVEDILAEIDQVRMNTLSRALIEKTFKLQEMLDLTQMVTDLDIYKQLGPMNLCGVLHITYQEIRYITGAYMVCTLFKHHFFLAEMKDDSRKLRPIACLYIDDMKIESLINGQGLQCSCLFSWKLVFQYKERKFEFILSASSAAEETRWKAGILKATASLADMSSPVSTELRSTSFLSLDLTPLDYASNLAPELSRRPSLHSLGVSRTRSDLQHVIIRKTYCPQRHGRAHQIEGEIERPKTPPPLSALILTARRQERIRLERAISLIYTRDTLPYPGMCLATGEILFGPNSLTRHLSLRSMRYRRSSSVNLTNMSSLNDSGGITKIEDKTYEANVRKTRATLDTNPDHENENSQVSRQDSPALELNNSEQIIHQKPISDVTMKIARKTDMGSENADMISMKAIRSIFNSMSLRGPKKSVRSSLGGV